jgi:hypothetical protein
MRTTIDLPDALYRKTKALAALRGGSLKELVVRALEDEVRRASGAPQGRKRRRELPEPIRLHDGRTLDLTDFNFDDLLA